MTTTNDRLAKSGEDTVTSVTGEDNMSAATIGRLGARVIALFALIRFVTNTVLIVARHHSDGVKNDVREGQRELLAIEKALDTIDRVGTLDVGNLEGKGIRLNSIFQSRAIVLSIRSLLVRTKRVGKHVFLHSILHVIEPFRLTIVGLVIRWATKAVNIIRVFSAVLQETKTISLLGELDILILLEITLLQAIAPVRSLEDSHGREDVASTTTGLVLDGGTHIVRDEVHLRKGTSLSHALQLVL